MSLLPLLGGLRVAVAAEDPAARSAGALLAELGAALEPGPGGGVRLKVDRSGGAPLPVRLLDGEAVAGDLPGLPPGVGERAAGLALAGAALAACLAGEGADVCGPALLAQLYLPAVLAASYGAPPARRCAAPLPVGGGAVQADLGVAENARNFETLLETAPAARRSEPEALAREAQEWRLPVLPYRRRGAGVRGGLAVAATRTAAAPGREPRRVLDLTSMWAGPLATWLLASAGDSVLKVESEARLDGMRALDGRGIHPPGADPAAGNASGMYNALNRGKRRLDLDLREEDAREALLAALAGCDLAVESFSPRVMPSLRLDHGVLDAHSPGITLISVPALPPHGPYGSWVAFGAGVHAIGGLGEAAAAFAAPAFAYPDVLAGLCAHAVALAARYGRRHGHWRGGHLKVPISAALPAPVAARSRWWEPGDGARRARRRAGRDRRSRPGRRRGRDPRLPVHAAARARASPRAGAGAGARRRGAGGLSWGRGSTSSCGSPASRR